MSYRTLLLDADGTLLDFDASSAYAVKKVFDLRGYLYSDEIFERYEKINVSMWEKYERGEMERDLVLTRRFDVLMEELGYDEKGATFEHDYRDYLEANPFWIKGARELLEALRADHKLYIVTNGVARTQRKRFDLLGMNDLVDGVFVSELVGAQKPQKEFFDYCFEHIGVCDKDDILLLGDSLSADILGANNAGIASCWYNPKNKPMTGPGVPTFEIHSYEELWPILNETNGSI